VAFFRFCRGDCRKATAPWARLVRETGAPATTRGRRSIGATAVNVIIVPTICAHLVVEECISGDRGTIAQDLFLGEGHGLLDLGLVDSGFHGESSLKFSFQTVYNQGVDTLFGVLV